MADDGEQAASAGRLRAAGLRSTPARRAVLEVLAGTGDHLDADAVLARVAERAPETHRATVYRALHTLAEHHLVSHTHLPGDATVYHLGDAAGADGHAHLQCHRCGRVIDVPGDLLDPLAATLGQRFGFRLDPTHGALLGRCADCVD
ncbi:Fur family ferric uptake transcriptional regulator [Friedmanniella endophytica]|uniref:Fur family ferric uptake transcriptional regulator n=1 Tax=Microlunatus kandeliicorticis TaxID=1759536 RepID=A0A7W3IUC8_9ACTN|nr:Fur family transcriptional regulator [Microlunatus kandeliicorticis]MBA8795437.1 Fur family ferric uptake transcriptional regulator [Microlunatus kandeliicorticis]